MKRLLWLVLVLSVVCSLSGCFGGGGPVPQAKATIAGTVVDAYSQDPIGGAAITIGSHTARTDSSGSYTITSVDTGSYTISATATGYRPYSQTVSIVSGSQTINIELEPISVAITGQAYLPDDELLVRSSVLDPMYGRSPLSNATVSAYSFTTGLLVAGPAQTDANGYFSLEIPGGTDVVILCTKGDTRLSFLYASPGPVDSIEINILTTLSAEAYSKGLFGSGQRVNKDDLNALMGYVTELLSSGYAGPQDLSVGGQLIRHEFGQGLVDSSEGLGKAISDYVTSFSGTATRLIRGAVRELRRVGFLLSDTAYSEYIALQEALSENILPNLGNLGSQMEFVACVAQCFDPEVHSSGQWLVDTENQRIEPDTRMRAGFAGSVEADSVFRGVPSGPYSGTEMTVKIQGEFESNHTGYLDEVTSAALELSIHLENTATGAVYDGSLWIGLDSWEGQSPLEGQSYRANVWRSLPSSPGLTVNLGMFEFRIDGSILDPGMPEPLDVSLLVHVERSTQTAVTLDLLGSLACPGFSFAGGLTWEVDDSLRAPSGCVINAVSVQMTGEICIAEWGSIMTDDPTVVTGCHVLASGGSLTEFEGLTTSSIFTSSQSLTDWRGALEFRRRTKSGSSVAQAILDANPYSIVDVHRVIDNLGLEASFDGDITFRDGSPLSAGITIAATLPSQITLNLSYRSGSYDVEGAVEVSTSGGTVTAAVDFVESNSGLTLTATVTPGTSEPNVFGRVTHPEDGVLAQIRTEGGIAKIYYDDGGIETIF